MLNLIRLWQNAGKSDPMRYDPLHVCFHLGVCFGTIYGFSGDYRKKNGDGKSPKKSNNIINHPRGSV